MIEGHKEDQRSLSDRITDGTVSAEELRGVSFGEKELEAIQGYVTWSAEEEEYRLKDEGQGLEKGSEHLLQCVRKGVEEQLKLKGWSEVREINWQKMIDKEIESLRIKK
jgi:hypothetical protein